MSWLQLMKTTSQKYFFLGDINQVLPSEFFVVFRKGMWSETRNFRKSLIFTKNNIQIYYMIAFGFAIVYFVNSLTIIFLFMRKRRSRKKIEEYHSLYIK